MRWPEGEDLGPPPPPFRIEPHRARFSGFGGWNRVLALLAFVIVLYVVLNTLRGVYVDWLWFEGIGFEDVYTKRLTTQLILFFGGAGVFLVFFGLNLWFAARLFIRNASESVGDFDLRALRRLVLLSSIAGSLFMAVIFGSLASSEWDAVLRYFNAEPFGIEDPQFGRDIGFYVFELPALKVLQGWLMGALVITVLAAASLHLARYLLFGLDSKAKFATKLQLSSLIVAIIAVYIWRYYLGIFDLVFSTSGVVFGASYADVNATLPATYVMMAFGALTALAILVNLRQDGIRLPGFALGGWLIVAIVGGEIYPITVQRLDVEPDELEKERPYIARNIEATRHAFGLDALEERPFPAEPAVTETEIADNPDTIRNIRLLDVEPLLETYAQIQTFRPLYEFLDVDVDRYMIDGVPRQVMISPRELSPDRLPVDAQSWVNRRLQFTHGYGVVMSPVNEVVQEGLPDFFLSDIPVTGEIELTRPQIYYGEESEHYVIVTTAAEEFDYPVDEGNETSVFEGEGGVALDSLLRKIVFAWEFGDRNIVLSGSLTEDSRILFRRNIQDRVEEVAPFLSLDRDPYIVVDQGRLFWIQDAYTVTGNYPYSQPSADGVNYVRNSVKVVIDAYDGSMTFYVVDPEDPIIRTYERIFPDLFTPIEAMPESLRAHVRYPEDLFLRQVLTYLRYHITDPRALYNREDIWQIPTELFTDSEQLVEPYYVIMRIPGETEPEFVLILPLTPARRQNTIAWVAARSDGENYGRLLSFRFPTDSLVFGPRQVESRIDQDPQIAAQFSLWNQSGSQVIRGNLLMVPIGTGNLYIEPVYLQASTSQLPELKRVVVVNGNQIAMEPTLSRALEVVFGRAEASEPEGVPASPTPSGTATATPAPAGPTFTPGPGDIATPTPASPPVLGDDIAALAAEADAAFQRAQEALRNGDFATYGTEIARVEALIQRIVELTEP